MSPCSILLTHHSKINGLEANAAPIAVTKNHHLAKTEQPVFTQSENWLFCFGDASGHPKVEPLVWELSFDENGVPDLENTILKIMREVA